MGISFGESGFKLMSGETGSLRDPKEDIEITRRFLGGGGKAFNTRGKGL